MKTLMSGAGALCAGLCAALAAAAPASADQWEDEVLAQLLVVGLALDGEGWELDREIVVDSLGAGESDMFSFKTEPGVEYALIGVCDTDCADLDMTLFDKQGNFLTEDAATDDAPVLQFVALKGKYRLGVSMYHCAVEPCRYGVALFSN